MEYKRRLVIGDTHGSYLGLMQALQRACFNPENDELIVLGDTMDGWSGMGLIMDYYIDLNLKYNCIRYILGNHDSAFMIWVRSGCKKGSLLTYAHGGAVTEHVYLNQYYDEVEKHYDYLRQCVYYYHDKNLNDFYVHAGWDPKYHVFDDAQMSTQEYMWDRHFIRGMYEGRNYAKQFNQVFVGHTPVMSLDPKNGSKPINRRNVWDIDTGAGYYKGKVTVMDSLTHEYWQSDTSRELYPIEVGRGG